MPDQKVQRRPQGIARMATILDAAVAVFARVGVERATTNAIAAEAGISPGSLYQYFQDKADIARAVGARYAEQVTVAHRAALTGFDIATAPLETVLDRILDPIVEFKDAHAAFALLFARTDLPESIAAPVTAADAAFSERVTRLLSLRNPSADAGAVHRSATTAIMLFRGVVGALGQGGDQKGDLAEVKLALRAYLAASGLR